MRSLRWVGLVFSLLIVGGLGGLMAPLPSGADNSTMPILTIDGVTVNDLVRITNVNSVCPAPDTSYNSCWTIPGTNVTTEATRSDTRQIGAWYVGDVSATNGARVLMNDASAAGSIDSLKITGITFTPVVAAGTKVTHAIVTHIYNQGGGNISGDYQWAMAQGGQFDPLSNENVVGNRLKLTGTGTASGNISLGVLDTGVFTTPTANNLTGSVSRSLSARVVKASCNTGSGRCAPTIMYDYEITVVGQDTLFLTDSVFGAGGVCYKGAKLALLKLIDHIFDQFDALKDDEHPLGCNKFAEALNVPTEAAVAEIVQAGIDAGAVVAETCVGACIVINKTVDPDLNTGLDPVEFGFTGTGAGINNFTLTTDGVGGESTTFSNLVAGASTRTITETGFPYVPDTFDNVPPEQSDHDSFWWTQTVSCESTLSGNVGNAGPSLWTTFAPTFSTVHNNRFALGNDASLGNEDPLPTDPEIAPLRQGYVTVTNLAAGDTITCTVDNRLYNDDHPNNNPDEIIND